MTVAEIENLDIEMVKVIYVSTNEARHGVYGGARVLGGRPIRYGYRKNGDVFNVAVADIVVAPHRFNAWPCNKPFIIKGDKVVDPCEDTTPPIMPEPVQEIEPDPPVVDIESTESLVGLPGIGPKTAEILAEYGIVSERDLLLNMSDEIFGKLPPVSRRPIKVWQEAQK